ncbi:mechanosensitive ion channel [candidate division KSB1 bacterium]|nr:mechanosensitive ion channel [candidate division KSB1 bacterium]
MKEWVTNLDISSTSIIEAAGTIVFVLLLALVLLKLAKVLSSKVTAMLVKKRPDGEYKKRAETLSAVVRHVSVVIIWAIAIMVILSEVGIEIGPILAAAGIVGLAVGFGAQDLVKDVINGFFILLEDQIRVGDVVQIADKAGLVEKVNLKMTILRDLQGHVHFIPNGSIDTVTNMTKEFSFYLFEFGVAYREDVDQVIEVIKQVDEDIRNDENYKNVILEPIEIFGLDKFADSAIIIKARIKTMPIKQWYVGREFNRRIKRAFDEKDIEIPFPHLTLYMGQDKSGDAPPLYHQEKKS